MSSFIYSVRLMTNMHAGSGEANIGIIDNLVQRDAVTDFPCVNSSGVKGALREYCEKAGKLTSDDIRHIFGYSKGNASYEGCYKFFALNLAAIPVRSNARPYYLAVSKQSLEDLIDFVKVFGKKVKLDLLQINGINERGNALVKESCKSEERIEGLQAAVLGKNGKDIFNDVERLLNTNKDLVLLHDEDFLEIVRDGLPVIPRNHLEDGVSKNLWYEQIIPRESIFYTAIVSDDNENKLESVLEDFIQIGANATIGYGITKFTQMEVEDVE